MTEPMVVPVPAPLVPVVVPPPVPVPPGSWDFVPLMYTRLRPNVLARVEADVHWRIRVSVRLTMADEAGREWAGKSLVVYTITTPACPPAKVCDLDD